MSNFDIDINTNDISSDISYSGVDGDSPEKKDWKDKLEQATQFVQSASGYGASKQGIGFYEQNKRLQGTKVTKFGLDPLVFIVVSFGVILGTGITILMLNKKKA